MSYGVQVISDLSNSDQSLVIWKHILISPPEGGVAFSWSCEVVWTWSSSADTLQFAQINWPKVCAQVREDEFPDRRLRGEAERVREASSEAAEVLHLHRDVHLLLSETDRPLHHTLVLQLRQRAGGVEQLSARTSRLEPRPESKDRGEDESVSNQEMLNLYCHLDCLKPGLHF